jgi:hypothetical protein
MQKPIGYWLKTLDRLIDENFDRALAAEGAQRRHWQILNIVKTSPATNARIAAALDPFWTEGAITLDEALADMTRRGWITAAGATPADTRRRSGARRHPGADQPPREDHGRPHCRAIHPDRRRPRADGRQPHAGLTRPRGTRPGRRRRCTPAGTSSPMPGCRDSRTTWTGAMAQDPRHRTKAVHRTARYVQRVRPYRSDPGAAPSRRSGAAASRKLSRHYVTLCVQSAHPVAGWLTDNEQGGMRACRR